MSKPKAEVARRASERHTRRLRELTGQQQKLVQLFYKCGVSEEVLQAEQERINTEKAKAQRWADAATREVEDVMGALDDALLLLDNTIVIYETLPHSSRRLINQAIFLVLIVRDPDTIHAQRTPLYHEIALLVQDLAPTETTPQTAAKRGGTRQPTARAARPQNDLDPDFRGRGSYIEQMAERAGFEPAMEFDPHTRLAGECLQPLGHLSWRFGQFRGCRADSGPQSNSSSIEQMAGLTGRLSKHDPVWRRIGELHTERFGHP
jgi:hypothetical protein